MSGERRRFYLFIFIFLFFLPSPSPHTPSSSSSSSSSSPFFLFRYSAVAEEPAEDDDIYADEHEEEGAVFENVDVNDIAEWIFDAAKDESTRDCCRKGLYDMNKAFLKRIKQVETMVKEKEPVIAEEDGDDDLMDEVDEQLRLQAAEEVRESAKKKSKKDKKDKKKIKRMAEEEEEEEVAVEELVEERHHQEEEEEEEEGQTASAKKSKKSKKDKRDKEQKGDKVEKISAVVASVATPATPPVKKRRPSVDITEMRDSDDDLKTPPDSEKSRRLSWGVNKSKSFKKSMGDLKTVNPLLSPPPKNGVLKSPRYSHGKTASSKKRQKRASATDYF